MATAPPNSRTEKFRASALKTEGSKDEAERMVDILRSWDTDGDGMFSVQEVLSAARQMNMEKKKTRSLKWVVAGLAILYVATILVLLGVTVAAVEVTKDQRPDADGNLISVSGNKDVVHTKSKIDAVNPFDFVGQDLSNFENIDSLYLDDLGVGSSEGVKEFLQRVYKVRMVTRNKKHDSIKIDFFGGDYLEVSKDEALLFRPKPEGGCGDGIPEVNGYCAVAQIVNEEEPTKEESDERRLQARSSIVGPAYNTGPRGIGSNVNFNTGRIYGSEGIVSLGRSRFFGQGQFRSCDGPSCSF